MIALRHCGLETSIHFHPHSESQVNWNEIHALISDFQPPFTLMFLTLQFNGKCMHFIVLDSLPLLEADACNLSSGWKKRAEEPIKVFLGINDSRPLKAVLPDQEGHLFEKAVLIFFLSLSDGGNSSLFTKEHHLCNKILPISIYHLDSCLKRLLLTDNQIKEQSKSGVRNLTFLKLS